jgi:AraC-like DNA-binding protein
MERLASNAPDAVSEALQSLSVHSSVFCLSELRAPWGFEVDGAATAKFHLVLAGSCFLLIDDAEPARLDPGDVVVLPSGRSHALADTPHAPECSLDDIIADTALHGGHVMRHGGQGATTRLLCGGFLMNDTLPKPVSSLLPEVLRLDAAAVRAAAWLEPVLINLSEESLESSPGAQAIQSKIADVFVAQALRTWLIGAQRAGVHAHATVNDECVGKALSHIRERCAEAWTLERLGNEVGLSKTALSTRFRALTGDSPMQHLTRIRLSRAAGQLATSSLSLDEIARQSGYSSDAALSKAFRREFGQSPGAYREAARRTPQIGVT